MLNFYFHRLKQVWVPICLVRSPKRRVPRWWLPPTLTLVSAARLYSRKKTFLASCTHLPSVFHPGILVNNWNAMLVPVLISGTGIVACIFTSLIASHLMAVKSQSQIEPALKRQLLVSTVLETPLLLLLCYFWLPKYFCIGDLRVNHWGAAVCAVSGLWAGLLIGYVTEVRFIRVYILMCVGLNAI